MSFGLISRAVIGATTAGLMIVSAGGTAFADEGGHPGRASSPLYNAHLLPAAAVAVAGSRASLIENDDRSYLVVHATGLQGPTATVSVFVYDQNVGFVPGTKCQFPTPAVKSLCGGPNLTGAPAAVRDALCAKYKFDSCNLTNFHVLTFPAQTVVNGKANFVLPLGSLPAGAEVQLYVGPLDYSYINSAGKVVHPNSTAVFHVGGSTADEDNHHGSDENQD